MVDILPQKSIFTATTKLKLLPGSWSDQINTPAVPNSVGTSKTLLFHNASDHEAKGIVTFLKEQSIHVLSHPLL